MAKPRLHLAAQRNWTVPSLIAALDRVLTETYAADWVGQVRWLNQWQLTGDRHQGENGV